VSENERLNRASPLNDSICQYRHRNSPLDRRIFDKRKLPAIFSFIVLLNRSGARTYFEIKYFSFYETDRFPRAYFARFQREQRSGPSVN